MTTVIGRVGRGSIIIDCIDSFNMSGRTISLHGSLHAPGLGTGVFPTAAQMTALLAERQRLVGYEENFDEPIVPIIWDSDPTVSGFYRLTSISCDVSQGGLKSGLLDFNVEARQVLGYTSPQFESHITGAQVSNVDLVVGESWMSYPAASIDQFFSLNCRDVKTRMASDGSLYFQRCFAAGTLITTYEGPKPIEEVEVGDLVLTHRNRWRPVRQLHQHEADNVVRVSGQGHGHGIVTTADHSFWARESFHARDLDPKGTMRLRAAEPEWIPAGSLVEKKAYWATPTEAETIELLADPPAGFGDDPLLAWWMVGRWLGDGYVVLNPAKSHRKVCICCGHHEEGHLAEKMAETGTAWRLDRRRTATEFILQDEKLGGWLKENFGSGAGGKYLPGWALTLDEPRRRALLDGYMSADGYFDGRSSVTATVSHKLAISLRHLAESLGYRVRMYRREQKTDVIEGRKVNVQPFWYLAWQSHRPPSRYRNRMAGFEDRGQAWSFVKNVSPEPAQAVYNIGVEEDHSYVAEGTTVKNCFDVYSGTMRYWVVPTDFYVGASTIKIGTVLEPVVGAQIISSPNAWELSNGLVRVRPADTAARLSIAWADGVTGVYETAKTFELAGIEPFDLALQRAGRINSISSLTILRNSPEVCSIRLGCGVEMGITWGTLYVDLTLRRGDYLVRGRITSFRQEKWRARRGTAEAATSLSGGLRATADDVDGNRYLLASPTLLVKDLVQGSIAASVAAYNFDFGIGMEVGGSTATLADTAASVIAEYFGGQSEKLILGGR